VGTILGPVLQQDPRSHHCKNRHRRAMQWRLRLVQEVSAAVCSSFFLSFSWVASFSSSFCWRVRSYPTAKTYLERCRFQHPSSDYKVNPQGGRNMQCILLIDEREADWNTRSEKEKGLLFQESMVFTQGIMKSRSKRLVPASRLATSDGSVGAVS
jgi:hypothetical protein